MKTALISGGAARIGAQIVRTLHENGYKVIIHCHQSEEVAQTLCRELNSKQKNSAQVIVVDLGDNKDIKKLTQTIKSLDLLVNNASVFYPTSIKNSTIEDWDKTININLRAPFFIATGLSKVLAISQGSIINIIDIHSDRPLKKFSIYNISKAGLKMLTKTLAKELAPNIRVNGISPGSILWPQDESQLSDKEKMMMLDRIALKRQGSPNDIAQAVLFLANAKYITGQVINIDGGRSLNQ
jgi:pteridine reductase